MNTTAKAAVKPAAKPASAPVPGSPVNFARWAIWIGFIAILALAPQVFTQGAAISILCQVGILAILCLSYNMLLGQGGMLSFGHAVYSGLGAFFAIHAINMVSKGSLSIPLPLVPLIGGFAGLFFGLLFGYVITKKSGTTFAMITLGICELVHSMSLMIPEFFGGEGGVAGNRKIGTFLGFTFGPAVEVYYLIAFWMFVCTLGMFAFTQTPLGRIINAVRDNPERVEFVGYDTQWVRYMTLILSAFFAGIAGALGAIHFESVGAEDVSVARSADVLLYTYMGGVGSFFGPIIGAVVGVFMMLVLKDYSNAWQLYVGGLFIIIVMYTQGGISGVIMQNVRLMKYGKFARVFPYLLAVCVTTIVAVAGAIVIVEMLYFRALDSANGTTMKLFGYAVDTATAQGWLFGAAVFIVGIIGFVLVLKPFRKAWDDANIEIEEQIAKA
jgi:branched-chain amino acid transport system permease protein